MEALDRQDAFHLLLDPARLRQGLALGAVAIPARVVRRALFTARRAHIEVPAERGRSTAQDIAHRAALFDAQSVSPRVCLAVSTLNVGHLQARWLASGARQAPRLGSHGSAEDPPPCGAEQLDGARHGGQPCATEPCVVRRARQRRMAEQYLHGA
jgi:hypothetical protein